jgi:hypothetical protein
VIIRGEVIDWLFNSDHAIRWQVMRHLLGASEHEWSEERARVETDGWGQRLLSYQDTDGQWAGGAFAPSAFDWTTWDVQGQPWTATTFSLTQLREFGLDPTSARARTTVGLVGQNSRWEHDGQPFWQGEVEECINGRTVADGAYFGADVSPLVQRLIGEQLDDGGWNCERVNGSVRSSFDTTINVLEGLLEYERATGGTPESRKARFRGEEYLLKRNLYRSLSTGEPADDRYLSYTYPNRWRYDLLRGLNYFAAASQHNEDSRDSRLGPAIEHLQSKCLPDGRWLLDWKAKGEVWFDVDDGVGLPPRWITLRALRVLRWWIKA